MKIAWFSSDLPWSSCSEIQPQVLLAAVAEVFINRHRVPLEPMVLLVDAQEVDMEVVDDARVYVLLEPVQ